MLCMNKIGRNDPCPCGSGKKYKKCCAKKALGPRQVTVQQTGGDIMQRMSKTTSALSGAFPTIPTQPDQAKSLSDRVSSGGKDINAAEVFKKDEDQNSET